MPGRLAAAARLRQRRGVSFTGSGATFNNAGTVSGGSGGFGSGVGVSFTGSGATFNNAGTVSGGSGGSAALVCHSPRAGRHSTMPGPLAAAAAASVAALACYSPRAGRHSAMRGSGCGGSGGGGGAGVSFTGSGATFNNAGVVTGGTAAAAVSFTGSGATFNNAGAVTGGRGGGAGIVGTGLTVINSGIVSAGRSLAGDPADAITFTGGTNILELRTGSTITGNVVAFSTADTLRLGGTSDASFDVSQIGNQYLGFGLFQKTGAARGRSSAPTRPAGPGRSTVERYKRMLPWRVRI